MTARAPHLTNRVVFERHLDVGVVDRIDDCDQDDLDLLQFPARPCPVCGSRGVCGFDSRGRALIHADAVEDA